MDGVNRLEEKLREAASYGDEEAVRILLEKGVDLNSQNPVNGWTALHWASKRGHVSVVKYLLQCGADQSLTSAKGETPWVVAETEDVRNILGRWQGHEVSSNSNHTETPAPLPITPHYLAHPATNKVDLSDQWSKSNAQLRLDHCESQKNLSVSAYSEEVVLKVRVAGSSDPDFIEVELKKTDLTYGTLLQICCEELGITARNVLKIRKLPNTKLRKDKDVQRLTDYQELEVVLVSGNAAHGNFNLGCSTNVASNTLNSLAAPSGYINLPPRSLTVGSLLEKSNYCKNGTILY